MKFVIRLIILTTVLFSCKNKIEDETNNTPLTKEQECALKKDTTIVTNLTLANEPFFADSLVSLMGTKTEFRIATGDRYLKPKLDSTLFLQEEVCRIYGSFEIKSVFYQFNNVLSKTIWLKSVIPVKGYKKYFPTLELTVVSFANESDKNLFLNLTKNATWGDPNKKWNNYSTTMDKTHIYKLENYDATFQDYDEKYIKWIEKNWIKK